LIVKLLRRHKIFLFILLLYSCGVKRYLPEGEKLYNGPKVIVELVPGNDVSKSAIRNKLSSIATPKRNKMIFGMPYKVWWWYVIGQPKKEKGFKYWLRNNLGQEPVFISQANHFLNAESMQTYLNNNGYFNSIVNSDSLAKGYKSKMVYYAKVERPYYLASIHWRLDSSQVSSDIARLPTDETQLKKGEQYSVDKIKAEAEHINQLLKDKGYYYFKADDIVAYVDTNQNNYTAALLLGIKKQTPALDKIPFKINTVTTIVNRSSLQSISNSLLPSSPHDGIYVVDSAKKYKPQVFPRAITIRNGDIYSSTEQNKSLLRLNSYGTFRLIKTEFKRPVNSDSTDLLDAYYYTTDFKKKRLQTEFGGFGRSNNFMGGQLSLTWRNRNLLKGAEILNIKTTGSFEVSVNDSLKENNNWRLGAEISLVIPKFLTPFSNKKKLALVPRTRLVNSYDWVRKPDFYTQYYLHGRYELDWSNRIKNEHRFIPLSATYYRTGNLSDLMGLQTAREPKLDLVIPPSLIAASSYQYFIASRTAGKTNFYNLHTSFETSGFVIGLIKGTNGYFSSKILNAYFMQYVRGEIDFRYIRRFGVETFLANRIIIGASYPYGNSPFLPFSRQFLIGGANSLRGFLPRQIGPGSTKATSLQQTAYPQIGGDYKLEMNSELRFTLSGRLKSTFFIDAGNIWMKDSILYSTAGQLSKDFIKQFALDVGTGLRFDLTLLIIRLDLGIPIYKPYLTAGERWIFHDFNIGDPDWRRENLVLNFAIGYPF